MCNQSKTINEFLLSVKETSIQAFENQSYQFEDLVQKLDVKRNASRNPLFDVMFAYQNNPVSLSNVDGLHFTPYEMETRTSKFDITLTVSNVQQGYNVVFEYSTHLFEKRTIENMKQHFLHILDEITENPAATIETVKMLSKPEADQLINCSSNAIADFPRDKTVQELFEEQAKKTPDREAIIYEGKSITYRS